MLAELVQDLVHHEGGRDGLDQDSGTDGSTSHANFILGKAEGIVPKAGFKVVLHLGQVEVGSETSLDLLVGVMEEEETKVEQRSRHGLPVNGDVSFLEMPSSCSDEKNGMLVVELVLFARLCVFECNLTADGIVHVDLAIQLICPCRCIRVWQGRGSVQCQRYVLEESPPSKSAMKVAEPEFKALMTCRPMHQLAEIAPQSLQLETDTYHLAIDGPSDLDTSILETWTRRSAGPGLIFADCPGFRLEVG